MTVLSAESRTPDSGRSRPSTTLDRACRCVLCSGCHRIIGLGRDERRRRSFPNQLRSERPFRPPRRRPMNRRPWQVIRRSRRTSMNPRQSSIKGCRRTAVIPIPACGRSPTPWLAPSSSTPARVARATLPMPAPGSTDCSHMPISMKSVRAGRASPRVRISSRATGGPWGEHLLRRQRLVRLRPPGRLPVHGELD